jgi:SPP1 family holin
MLSVDKGTVIRGLVFTLAWLNTVLASKGYETIPHVDEVHVAMAVTFVVSVWGFVKHNFFGKQGKSHKEAIKNSGK